MRGIANESMRKLKQNSVSFSRATGSANEFRVITVLMTYVKKYRSVLKVNYQVMTQVLEDLLYFVLNDNIRKLTFLQAVFCQYRLTLIVNGNILILTNKMKQLTVQRNSSPSSDYASTELKLAATPDLTDDEQAVQTTPSQCLILKDPTCLFT